MQSLDFKKMSGTITLHLQEAYFYAIAEKRKVIEGRLGKSKYLALLPGAKICFCISPSEYAKAVDDEPSSERNGHKSEKLYCDLVKAIHYTSFREMLEIEGFSSVIPDARSIDEAIDIYRKFYTTEDEALYGAVALHLCCSKN